MSEEQGFRNIPGVPDGWELVRVGKPNVDDWFIDGLDDPRQARAHDQWYGCAIVRKIEQPDRYRAFANGAEYFANRRDGIAVDWKLEDGSPGFYAVVSANNSVLWVAFGNVIQRFGWEQAFEKLKFRHIDNSTSPFGVKIDES
jgi:hypothetical protein